MHLRILVDLANSDPDERLGWADLLDPSVVSAGLSEVEVDAYRRALEGYQLDRLLD